MPPGSRPSTGAASIAVERRRLLRKASVLGFVAGALSGLFGVGGGILIVPVLVFVLGVSQKVASGTSLAAVVPISVSALVGFATADHVDWPVVLCLVIGSVAGANIGAWLLKRLAARAVSIAFCTLLLATAARLVFDNSTAAGRGDLNAALFLGLVVLGLGTGILAGLLGVGGGIIMVPGMVILFGLAPVLAKGTSLAAIIPTGVMGTYRNMKNGNSDLGLAAAVGLPGVISSFAASRISTGLSDTASNRIFAALLIAVSLRMLSATIKEPGGDA